MENKRKRRPNGMGNIRKVSKNSYEGRITTGYKPDGKRKVQYVYGKTQKEVRQKMMEVIHEVDCGNYTEPSKIRLRDWLEVWVNEYSNDKKYSKMKSYKAAIRTHINPALGDYFLDELSPVVIQKFYNQLINPTNGAKPLMPKTAKNVHITLHAALNQAIDNEILQKNPCSKTKLAKVEKKQINFLTDEQIKAFIGACVGDIYYGALLSVIVFTGLRVGEALGLTWDSIDFDKGHIVIDKQLMQRPQEAGGAILSSTKNGKSRTLAPAPYVMQILKTRQAE